MYKSALNKISLNFLIILIRQTFLSNLSIINTSTFLR